MFGRKKNDLLAEVDKGTPQSSRKVVPFSKWLTQKDQIELVEKDMAEGLKFSVVRHKLSGGEQRGTLVVGVTSLTFLNKDDKIVFTHPYRVIQKYCVNDRDQFEYAFELSSSKSLIYVFNSPDANSIVASIDRNSLHLEKVMAGEGSGSKSANNSVRGDPRNKKGSVPMFDAQAEHVAAQSEGSEIGPKRKITDVPGLRFNVRLDKADGTKQRVVAVVNQEGVILMDPSADKGSVNLVAYQRFPWQSITSTQVSDKDLTLVTEHGATRITTPDAHALLEEINRQAILAGKGNLDTADQNEDVHAMAVATAARLAVSDSGDAAAAAPKSPRGGADTTKPSYAVANHQAANVKTRDFAPAVFANLRRQWRVTNAEYADEWDVPNPRRHQETPGLKGKHNPWVVSSKTGRFLAVELSSSECDAFIKNLDEYVRFVAANPGTLLARVVGLHRVSVLFLHFAVYINPTPLGIPVRPTIYNLHASGLRLAPAEAREKPGAHLLDKDFVNDHRSVFLSYRDRKRTQLAIANDAMFLTALGVSDYVLQVSISAFDESKLGQVKAWVEAATAAGYNGVFLSPLEDEVYSVAVTHLESRDDDKTYAQQFYDHIKRRVFTSPDPSVADLEWEKTLPPPGIVTAAAATAAAPDQPPKSPRGGAGGL